MNETINFHGLTLRPEKVIGCGEIEPFKNGPAIGDWVLGFRIYCEGNTIKHCVYKGYPIGFPNGEEYEKIVKQRRNEFIELFFPPRTC